MILPDIKFNVGEYFAYKNELYKVAELIVDAINYHPHQWANCYNVELGTLKTMALTTECFKLDTVQIREHVEYHLEKLDEKAARLKAALEEIGG